MKSDERRSECKDNSYIRVPNTKKIYFQTIINPSSNKISTCTIIKQRSTTDPEQDNEKMLIAFHEPEDSPL
jgi:hypothetical protein